MEQNTAQRQEQHNTQHLQDTTTMKVNHDNIDTQRPHAHVSTTLAFPMHSIGHQNPPIISYTMISPSPTGKTEFAKARHRQLYQTDPIRRLTNIQSHHSTIENPYTNRESYYLSN